MRSDSSWEKEACDWLSLWETAGRGWRLQFAKLISKSVVESNCRYDTMADSDPLNLAIFERPDIREGMNIYVLGIPGQRLKDGKQCSRCLTASSKLYTCAKCRNPGRLYCVCLIIVIYTGLTKTFRASRAKGLTGIRINSYAERAKHG